MERLVAIVTAVVFGPILIGGFFSAVWPGVFNLLLYIFWFFVAVAAIAGMIVLVRKLLALNKEERAQRGREREARAREEEIQNSLRRQREELEALHTTVRNAYDDIFDSERRRAPPRISQ